MGRKKILNIKPPLHLYTNLSIYNVCIHTYSNSIWPLQLIYSLLDTFVVLIKSLTSIVSTFLSPIAAELQYGLLENPLWWTLGIQSRERSSSVLWGLMVPECQTMLLRKQAPWSASTQDLAEECRCLSLFHKCFSADF